jgi:hypothetical protein
MCKAAARGILALSVALASAASADVTIRIKDTHDLAAKKPQVSTGTICFNSDRMSARWDDAGEQRNHVIFRADKQLMWIVDDRKKSYQQIDKAFLDQMADRMTAAKAQMQARLDQMPPEQRAKAEEMMKKFAGGAVSASAELKLDYRKTGETRTIDGQRCTKYDTYLGKDLISYAWVAPYSALKLSQADGAVFEKMSAFVAETAGPYGSVRKKDYIPMHELGGIPLLTQQVDDGKITSETQVESVTRGAAPADGYDLPAGYTQESMPMMALGKHE